MSEVVLVVCTANQCRSPMAVAMLRAELDSRAAGVVVASAGFLPGGVHCPEEAVKVMDAAGFDLRDHLSRQIDDSVIAEADLVVTMTRQHLVDLIVSFPALADRAFTAAELLRRGNGRPRRPSEPLREWAERLSGGRKPADVLSEPLSADVPDPMGGRLRQYEKVRRQLEEWAEHVAALVAPLANATSA